MSLCLNAALRDLVVHPGGVRQSVGGDDWRACWSLFTNKRLEVQQCLCLSLLVRFIF